MGILALCVRSCLQNIVIMILKSYSPSLKQMELEPHNIKTCVTQQRLTKREIAVVRAYVTEGE